MAESLPPVWLEEELTCPICLQIYTDPVILNCKHSFCHACIEESWREPESGLYSCPECRANYRERPVLKRNFKLANIAQKYQAVNGTPVALPCNYCTKKKLSAVKTCLKCEASMCAKHLKHHRENAVFKNHPLIDPTADMSTWKCLEHKKLLEIYCKDDKVCICCLCPVVGKHKNHNCVSISEGEQELRDHLQQQIEKVRANTTAIRSGILHLQAQRDNAQSLIRESKAKVQERCNALRRYFENEEKEALKYLDTVQNQVTQEIDAQISALENQMELFEKNMDDFSNLLMKIEKLVFIQGFNSMRTRIKEASEPLGPQPPPPDVSKITADKVNWIQKQYELVSRLEKDRDVMASVYGQTPTLDMETAHRSVLLSDDRRLASGSRSRQPYPPSRKRFDCWGQVLCSEEINGGRSYWEVEISGVHGRWAVGVCYGSIKRKGRNKECVLGENNKSWSVGSGSSSSFWSYLSGSCSVVALHNDNVTDLTVPIFSKVGVFVDFDAGIISFYSVLDSKLNLICTFQQQSFSESLYPALKVSDWNTSLRICSLN
ncbi:E3 ubiquitin-protein ligase TRIM21-like isoform X1 [Hypanus sabinus]|uniref:E3 ubiquitin-protein ligase TRIM21-like isoform X1 n=1 Tax=Hypanus sabinus TaxID=79690 RepID=UPI0028C4C205|nr:E3 ubiquitin-protein ligase TRIM21-like isoform X1 [Hypanus sabinus]